MLILHRILVDKAKGMIWESKKTQFSILLLATQAAYANSKGLT